MLFSQVFGRRVARGVNDREIKMRIGVIGLGGDGFEYFFLRRFLPALLARGDTEIIVRRGTLGIDGKRLRQFGERVVEFCLPIINDAEGGVRKLVLGATATAFFKVSSAALKSAAAKINHAKIGKRIEVVRTLGEEFRDIVFSAVRYLP